ncbi:hypothetical protein MCUN1_003902 [Malassezia cuniculi]|uniref:Rhodanese domain-containing protein n=1 Tax=Malassezia cuniculi TaxID=948313 RepID=A0AAF0EXR6_9BASI|nr:hypothetical protein MCUN1_003902 [Malassezia cuniculi]
MSLPPIISHEKLAELLASSTPPRVIDATFVPGAPEEGQIKFLEGPRIQGSTYWNVAKVATRGESVHNLPFMLPSAETFAEAAAAHGITPETPVVVYDRAGVFAAPRTVYTFRAFGHNAALLDGGLPAWMAANQSVDSETLSELPATQSATYPTPKLNSAVVRSFDEMLANVNADSRAPVVDARGPGMFDGSIATGNSPVRGHIPHSVSLPFGGVLVNEPYAHYKSESELAATFDHAFGSGSIASFKKNGAQVITTCAGGLTAAILWLALQSLGVEAALYDESWLGWSIRAAQDKAPVEV